jgi:hypothetical protein
MPELLAQAQEVMPGFETRMLRKQVLVSMVLVAIKQQQGV